MVGSNDGWSGEMTAQRKIEMVQTTQISVAKQGLTGWMDGWMAVKICLMCWNSQD